MAIRVLIVDDSALMRAMLTEIIGGAADLQVVGAAPDAIAAREMIKALRPDVLTLDVDMPKMDGIEFLSRIMRLRPMPVVMISALTERGSEVALKALATGAVDFVAKPRAQNAAQLLACAEEIRDKIRGAYAARLPAAGAAAATVSPAPTFSGGLSSRLLGGHVVAIGASTGGPEAITAVLRALPAAVPGIVMVQHMPEGFTGSFARRLAAQSRLKVVEARGGERIEPGCAYLAPGHSHLLLRRAVDGFVTVLSQDAPVNRHRPSVDALFSSVAQEAGSHATGVLLTGMGKDGARGLLEMRQAGAWTIGQDEASCVVYGMPREAAAIGAVAEVAPLSHVAASILARLRALEHG